MRRPDLDDLEREMRDHVEEDTQENIARGMAPDEARAAAIRKFGNPVRVKEDVRAVWVPRWADQIGQDVRDAARRLRRHPGFALVIVATLALGIALPTAIYSVVNAVLLRPLWYAHPDRLVWPTTRSERDANRGGGPSDVEILNEIDFYTWQQQSVSFDHLVGYTQGDSTIAGDGEALRVRVLSASEGFWDISGARAVAGVLPSPADRQALVLSHRLFVERFDSDPGVIGRAISLDGQPMTITAVLAPDFNPQLPAMRFVSGLSGRIEPDVFRGMRINPPPRTMDRSTQIRILQAIGQLKEGITIEQARAELNTVHTRAQQIGTPFGPSTVLLIPLHERLVGASRRALTLLLAAGFCVLLITCANVANLLLSRCAARQKEIALRMSVGGGPLRVIRQLLAESIAYALIGGAAGVLLATWLVSVVVSVIGPAVPRLLETTVDLRVLGFAMAVSLGTALVFGMGPAINLARTNAQDVLKEGTRTSSIARPRRIAGRVMIAVQLALTVVLLTGAGLMLKSTWHMTSYPDGFSPDQILTLRVDFRGPAYRQPESRQQLAQSLLARAQTLPSVREAAMTTLGGAIMLLIKEGEVGPPENRESRETLVNRISPGFPRTMGMKIVHGRGFEDIEPVPVVLINEALAARDYAGADPIGQRIRLPWLGEDGFGTIVGVVSNMKYTRIDADMQPEVFFHTAQTDAVRRDARAADRWRSPCRRADDPQGPGRGRSDAIDLRRPDDGADAGRVDRAAPFQPAAAGHVRVRRRVSRGPRRLRRRRARGGRTHARDRHPPRAGRRAPPRRRHDRVRGHAQRDRRRRDRYGCGGGRDEPDCRFVVRRRGQRSADVRRRHARADGDRLCRLRRAGFAGGRRRPRGRAAQRVDRGRFRAHAERDANPAYRTPSMPPEGREIRTNPHQPRRRSPWNVISKIRRSR